MGDVSRFEASTKTDTRSAGAQGRASYEPPLVQPLGAVAECTRGGVDIGTDTEANAS